jgi:hypothetical protein
MLYNLILDLINIFDKLGKQVFDSLTDFGSIQYFFLNNLKCILYLIIMTTSVMIPLTLTSSITTNKRIYLNATRISTKLDNSIFVDTHWFMWSLNLTILALH